MVIKDSDPFAALEGGEQQRLDRLYSGLREKLLDLTKRNRMLNYSLGARSRRHLQIVDEVPEEIYRLLVTENASLEPVPIPEPDDIPEDEKTEEFISALEHAKISEIEYLTALKALESTGRDDDHTIMAAERKLRERVRVQLGMPPRPKRIEINRNEHARRYGIEANPELPKKASKKSHSDKKLQTFKFPDELEAAIEKIADDARSAEQEMGLSTLFISFGFLEWYESDTSDKKHFAPLLLLPVKLDSRKVQNKKVYSITATAGSVESNLSLQKYLERDFGRLLPDFEPDDEESAGSIEAYFDQAQKTIDGLNRWRICRWLVLGHFAFGRLAMYADLAAERWKHHPAGHKLVQSVLRGTDGDNESALPTIPDDYFIDDPEVEKIAPFLIHDADASQHSALVDVVKGGSLVIQGPPGTGKSQTITNIIANALSLGKTILFLSEKQAALEVVKRRLDQAGLGEFCLEIHSDKSSSKQVIASLNRRIDLGFGKGKSAAARSVDLTWLESRKAISEYLKALHSTADDGQTPFQLMWRSIRGRSIQPDLMGLFKNVPLPPHLLKTPSDIAAAMGQLEIYSSAAQAYSDDYGHPAQSAWAGLGIDFLPSYEIGGLMDGLEELRIVAEELHSLARQNDDLISQRVDELRGVAVATSKLHDPPADALLGQIIFLDLSELERTLQVNESLRNVLLDLGAKPDLSKYPTELLSRACVIAEQESRPELLALTPAQLFDKLARRVDDIEKILGAVGGLMPALGVLDFEPSFKVGGLEAVARAIIITSQLKPEQRPWLGRFRTRTDKSFESARQRWRGLVAGESKWRTRIGNPCKEWPPAAHIQLAAKIIGKRHVGKLVANTLGFGVVAKRTIERLGFSKDSPPTSEELAELASHVAALVSFMSDADLRHLLESAWNGLDTPFNEISVGLKVRAFLEENLTSLPSGAVVVERVLGLSVERLESLAVHKTVADSFRASPQRLIQPIADASIQPLLPSLETELSQNRRTLAIDPKGELSSAEIAISVIGPVAKLRVQKDELERVLSRSSLQIAARSLGADDMHLRLTRKAIKWVKDVRACELTSSLREKLLAANAAVVYGRLCQFGPQLEKSIVGYDRIIGRLRSRFKLDISVLMDLGELVSLIDSLRIQRGQLPGFLSLRVQRKTLEELGFEPFLAKADATKLSPAVLPSVLTILMAHRRADEARRIHPELGQMAGSVLDARRKSYADRDKKKIAADRVSIQTSLLPAKPPAGNSNGPKKSWTEMALIKNELDKQQRFVPIRTLFQRAHHSLQALTPCFMMSPLSLAKFLPAQNIEFDLAIIDEASQMRPEDALGGLLRAQQIVVVGDPKQLPPTDFFHRTEGTGSSLDDEQEYEDVDDESILEACQKAFRQVRRLKWHYRSRCESLIAFSNREFYDNSLITFPMARPGSFSVDLVRVNGTYQGRQNVAEALRIAEEAISFMRHHAGYEDDALPTIGIAAVNIEQRDLIREEVRRLASGDALVEEFTAKAEKKGEPLFIKNLENVQGDERDFILISMTYGREPGATALKQRYGPINGKQGHRRLNVLFSRARQRVGLFTSFGSADVKPSEKSNEGVRVLQRYLEYAEAHGRAAVEKTGVEVDSDFEAEVADRLRAKSYEIDYQVGVSGFRIDLGVRHPDKPEMFLAGIECDGAQYHSSKSARDRDRLREEVLAGLGWKILRVWSTDWFENPNEETQKLVLKLEKLRAESQSQGHVADYNFVSAEEFIDTAETPAPVESDDVLVTESSNLKVVLERSADQFSQSPISAINGVPTPGASISTAAGAGPVHSKDVAQELRDFRETVIAREMADWEPERSILREGMIETFVATRLTDPDAWFNRVPQYQRQNTNPLEKQRYLERVCEIVSRIE